jgi:D-alanyl-D-alanine carboxypeptidase (penicillin-binding protein 5/6)
MRGKDHQMRRAAHSTTKTGKRQSLPARLSLVLLQVAIWIALLSVCVGFGPPVITDGSHPPLRLAPEDVDTLVSTRKVPDITAASALVVDLVTGERLFDKASTEARPPASTAKLMTALVVADEVPLNDVVLVSPAAAATTGSRMGLTAGERLTVRELLYGLLIPSGNDAAVALAEHVAGSQADFVDLMNARARAMGLNSTLFVNVHGLDAAGQLTSAADLVVLAKAVLQNQGLANIVTLGSATVAGRQLQNTNELLGTYDGVNGIKTGTTDNAGECLIASVTRDGRTTILVELGSQERFVDARKLLDYAFESLSRHDVGLPDTALAWIIESTSQSHRLRSDPTSDIFVPAWQRPLLLPTVRIDAGAVMTSTAPVGELRWFLGSELVATVPLSVWQGP